MRMRPLVLLLVICVGCGNADSAPPESPAGENEVKVVFVTVSSAEIAEPILGTGTIAAAKTTDLGPRVDGIIDEIFVRVGDRVAEGDPLFRTRQIDYEIRVEEAEHRYALARAEAHKAGRDRERAEELFRTGVASEELVDASRTTDDIARARLGTAKAARSRARQSLTDSIVTAPYAGTITQKSVDEGVMMRTMISGGSSVVQIMKIDIVVAIVAIPAIHLSRIHVGTPGRIRVDGVEGEFESKVLIVNDRIDHHARSIDVRLPIMNPDFTLRPGLFTKVELVPDSRTTLVLDRRALHGTGAGQYVFVESSEKRAVRRQVSTRDLDGDRVEVLDGLREGDRALISMNEIELVPGARVATAQAAEFDVAL